MPYTGSFSIPEGETNRTVTITLIPYPLSDFDNPGYFVKESLPSDVTILSINADWYDVTDRTLSLLKFNPTDSNIAISYTVRLDKEKAYDFYGTYKDKNKTYGEIQAQTITVEGAPLIDFSSIWNPNKKDAVTVITSSGKGNETPLLETTAYQSQPNFQLSSFIIPLFVALNCILGYLIYKKYYKKKLQPQPVLTTSQPLLQSLKYRIKKEEKKEPEVFTIIGDDD